MTSLARRVKGVGHELYIYSFSSFPDLFDDLHTRGLINCCETAIQNVMSGGFDSKTLKLIQTDMHARMSTNLTVMIWNDKQHMHILMNMHRPPTEGNM
jgi:hypothetical protein